jgi:hypothetical protein
VTEQLQRTLFGTTAAPESQVQARQYRDIPSCKQGIFMSSEAWVTIAVTAVVLYSLAKEIAPTDMVFMAAIVLLSVLGILKPAEPLGDSSIMPS